VSGISFTFFTSRDVVRHPLVAKIVRAYEAFEQAGSGEPGTGNGRGGAA
jgi:phosphate starvation-inducible PhoH-like protein